MLRKFVAPEIIFGEGARLQAVKYVRSFHAKKVFLVSDPGVAAAGWLGEVDAALADAGLSRVLFTGVSPNPRCAQVREGADLYRRSGCDLILAVGGGSPMDCAKGIGIVVTNGGDAADFEGIDRIGVPVPPLVFIPTTAGTSADVSQFAILSNERERCKLAIISKAVVPDVALVDPVPTATMDPYLTACTGIDALVHAIEAFVSTGAGPMTDLYALDAIGLIGRHLPAAVSGTGGPQDRERVMEASLKAGLAFSNAILGAVHAMAHSLGGYLDLPHGECNALLLEHVVGYNFSASADRYRVIARTLGLPEAGLTDGALKRALVDHLRAFRISLGIVRTLGDAGVRSDDIGLLSRKAAADPCLLTNPREARADDLAALYREAL